MKDKFTKSWILEKGIPIVNRYATGELTLRGLHYQLVAIGMTNSVNHYKRVVNTMIEARWNGDVQFNDFVDHDRNTLGTTEAQPTDVNDSIESTKSAFEYWLENYSKNRWENQDYYPEVWIEKKALIGTFERTCQRERVLLAPCKGYPSLTFLNDAADRFRTAENEDKIPIILYFGDYDASGKDIPRSIGDNLRRMGAEVEVKEIALNEDQVLDMGLPPAPSKITDSRSASWDGLGQVELDAVPPDVLKEMVSTSIEEYFDEDKFAALKEREAEELETYKAEVKEFVKSL